MTMKRFVFIILGLFCIGWANAQKHEWKNGLYWELNNGVLTISGNGDMPDYSGPWKYEGTVRKVVIEYGVTSIGKFFFSEGDRPHTLQSVEIANSVTSIGENAFWYCENLTSVSLPNSLTSIGRSAFEYCRGLTEVVLPPSLVSVGFGAFWGCTQASIFIQNEISNIDACAFEECKEIKTKISNGTMTCYIIKTRKNDDYLYGLANADGTVIIPVELNALEPIGGNFLKFRIGGYWGVVNFQGKVIVHTDRGYTSIGKYVSLTKRFSYEMAGYRGECNSLGQQVSKIKVSTPRQQPQRQQTNTASSSSSSNASRTTTGNQTTQTKTVVVEQQRTPVPVQEWVPCGMCNNSGQCHTCYGLGNNFGNRCIVCNGRGRCTYCAGQGGHYETRYR